MLSVLAVSFFSVEDASDLEVIAVVAEEDAMVLARSRISDGAMPSSFLVAPSPERT